MTRRALALLALLLIAAGCGAGAGDAPEQEVRLTVTRDFGQRPVRAIDGAEVRGSDTAMRLLQRSARVQTRYGGGFVQSIDGVAGGRRDGRPVDWFFYVNGVLAEEGAAAIPVRGGDRIWWDHHDWGVTNAISAVVGSFPQPFLTGLGGKRLPTRLECADPGAEVCDAVAERFTELGILAPRGGINAGDNLESIRVLVGRWDQLRDREQSADEVDEGPEQGGVFVRFDRSGRRMTLLDERGRPGRTLGAGTGLIAANKLPERGPVWLVTGTDDAGVLSAARALDESALADNYALAVSDDRGIAVPELSR
jgi:hypothetical protein